MLPILGFAQVNDDITPLKNTSTDSPLLHYDSDWMPSVIIQPGPQERNEHNTSLQIQGVDNLPKTPLTFTLTANAPSATAFSTPGSDQSFSLGAFWQLGRGVAEDSSNKPPTFALANTLGVQLQLSENNQAALPVATIQCAGSQLTQRTVIASGCRLTGVQEQNLQLAIGYEPLGGIQTRASLLQLQNNANNNYLLQQADINRFLLDGATSVNQLLGFATGNALGLQLGLTLELPTGNLGDFALNADWSSIDYQLNTTNLSRASRFSTLNSSNIFLNETLDTARLQLGWSNGNFSGGIESIYQETPVLPGLSSGEDLTTFNIEFSWRTPWHGAFSVGASNVMDSGKETITATDGLDSIYGRIPYVRYKQDLD